MKTLHWLSLIAAGLMILLFLLWRQHSEFSHLKAQYTDLQKQNLAMLNHSFQPQPASDRAPGATPQQTPAPAKQIRVEAPPVLNPPAPDKNRLVYSGTEVLQTPTGLVATLHFKASATGPLGLVIMCVRLPPEIGAMIRTLQPAGAAKYEDSETFVSENGRFATFQAMLGDEKDVAISLAVSGETRAFIKGSCGIPPIELSIQSTNATAKPFAR